MCIAKKKFYKIQCIKCLLFFLITREEQRNIKDKLSQIEKKIIVGGENLLEKAEEQERLLEESAKELERRTAKQGLLRRQLEEKEVSRLSFYGLS